MIMELQIARNKDGSSFLYNYFPVRDNDYGLFMVYGDDIYGDGIKIDSKLFPEVTWENSPKRVELKLI